MLTTIPIFILGVTLSVTSRVPISFGMSSTIDFELEEDTLNITSYSKLYSTTQDSLYYLYESAYCKLYDGNKLVEMNNWVYNPDKMKYGRICIHPSHKPIFSHSRGDSILKVGPKDTIYIELKSRYLIRRNKLPKIVNITISNIVLVSRYELERYNKEGQNFLSWRESRPQIQRFRLKRKNKGYIQVDYEKPREGKVECW